MSEPNSNSENENLEKIQQSFPPHLLFQGQRLLDLGRVSPSFFKGTLSTYVILSGIIADNNTTYQTKINLKKNDNGLKFTSQCTCHLWNVEDHCAHVTSLWLKGRELLRTNSQSLSFEGFTSNEGVYPHRFGTHVKGAPYLHGSKASSTFTSLHYSLTNRKIVPFSAPLKWKGKLVINIVGASINEDLLPLIHPYQDFTLQFSLLDPELGEIKEISIFDVLYLFNWKNGDFIDLPNEFIELFKKLRFLNPPQAVDDYLRLIIPMAHKNSVELRIEGVPFEQIPIEDFFMRFNIQESERKSFLNLELQIYNKNNTLLEIPHLFHLFVFDGGWLTSFRTKIDAVHFVKALVMDFENDTHLYRKFLHSSSKKQYLIDWIDKVYSGEDIFNYQNGCLYRISAFVYKKILVSMFEAFNENAFKASFAQHITRKITFYLPKNALLEGVNTFYKKLTSLQIPLFYFEQMVTTWKSNIRFERNRPQLDWFELEVIMQSEDFEIIHKADLNAQYIITNKGLTLLTDQEKDLLRFMKRYTKIEGEVKKDGSPLKRFALSLNRARIFELFELKKFGLEGALTNEEEDFCHRVLTLKEMPQYEVPARYLELARPYQLVGYQWLRFLYEHRFGACLADDMGLGKTLQAIMLMQSLKDKIKKVLIICPVSIIYNWRAELDRFSDLKYSVYYGGDRDIENDAQIVLTSYGLLKRESLSTFSETEFDIVIFDEVQHLKNIRSQGAGASRNLKAKFRLCLTGTPVENDLSEFYNIMDICVPGVWGELSLIRSTSKNKNRLIARQTVKPFILRRTKDQVLKELPEKIEHHVYLEFSPEEDENYKNKMEAIRNQMLNPSFLKKYGDVLKSLLELRQLCLWQKQPSFYSTKIDFLIENLEQLVEEGHKTLVFSQFTTFLDFIQNKIRERGWKYCRIDGSQTIKKRNEAVEEFQQGEAQIFLISLKAGGFGLNLTAASYIFLMDPWWNPAVERQAVDRAHRIGQENKLTVYRPIIKNSVEEKVLVLQQAKKELFSDLMAENDDEFYSGRLTMDDFKGLLS